jgi:hypothetical protein
VNELERDLVALAALVDWPDAPDVAPAVGARIAAPRRRALPTLRLGVVLAAVVLAVAVALAVPPARSAIFDWLGIGSARIELVDSLPPLDPVVPLDLLGEPTSLDEARSRAGFAFADPPRDEPAPDEVRVVPGNRVSYVWRDGAGVRLLVTQLPARLGEEALLKKLVPESTRIEELTIDGRRAVWLEGGPHAVFVITEVGTYAEDRGWLAGETLLVDRGASTLRIEGSLGRDRAVELARAMGG